MRLCRALCASLLVLSACAPSPPPTTGAVSAETFRSALLEDDYVLRLRLPPGYEDDPARRYPLVVQLDPTYAGLQEFATTAGLISQNAAPGVGRWPEAIVLGVDYPDPFTRERDYRLPNPPVPDYGGAGADLFYRALREEILPHIEARLRVDAQRRVLVGHSNGAVFTWYAALRHAPPLPTLFTGFVAADCGYDEVLFSYERLHAERTTSLPLRIYASRAAYNGAIQEITFSAFLQRLRGRAYPDLSLVSEVLETDHGGAIRPSFEHGLDHTFGAGGAP